MKNKNYDLTPLTQLVNLEYTPRHLAECLDEVIHCYVVSKFESGECGREDAVNVSTLRELRKAILAIENH